MKKIERISIMIAIFTFLFFPLCVYAYIDPGTGSYIIQIIIAALFGISFGIKLFWGKIKVFFAQKVFKTSKHIDEK